MITVPIVTTSDLPVYAHHHCMVSLVWFQSDLLLRLQLVSLQLLDLLSKHLGRFRGGIDAISLKAMGVNITNSLKLPGMHLPTAASCTKWPPVEETKTELCAALTVFS